MDEDDRGAERKALSPALLQAVPPPVDIRDGLRERAPARLVQERHPVREPEDLDRLVRREVSAIDDPDLDLERISRVERGIPCEGRGVELRSKVSEDVLEASLDEPLPDRAEAVRRRGHQLRGLHRVMERLRLFEDEGFRLPVWVEAGGIADFLRDAGRHPHELLFEERSQLVGFRLLHHGHERAELDSMRMRRNFLRLRREILRRWLAGRNLTVHHRTGNPKTLLSASLSAAKKSRSVQQASEDVGHFFLDDARSIVLHDHDEFFFVDLLDLDEDVREDVRISPRIEGIVHTLLDRREEGFRRRVVAEDLLVPLEELGDADLPLFLREFLRNRDRWHTITRGG